MKEFKKKRLESELTEVEQFSKKFPMNGNYKRCMYSDSQGRITKMVTDDNKIIAWLIEMGFKE